MRLSRVWMAMVLCIFCIPVAFGASYRFDISVENLDSLTPFFRFSKPLLASPKGTKNRVELNKFIVVAKGSQGWDYKNPLWAFELSSGSALEVEQIKYGVVPSGFNETTKVQQLSTGLPYMAIAFAPGGSGSREFILRNGRDIRK
jgi:hypothetical protein